MPNWTQQDYEAYLAKQAERKVLATLAKPARARRKDFGRKNPQHKNTCLTCGRIFFAQHCHKRKYCSPACAYLSKDRVKHIKKKDRGTSTCKNCGKVFVVRTVSPRGIFCSQPCAGSYIGKTVLQQNRPVAVRKRFISYTCPGCGKEFKAWACNHRKFCSPHCSSRDQDKIRRATIAFRSPKNRGRMYSRGSAGWIEVGDQRLYARSGWEANYALYLQFLKDQKSISGWEHEVDVFWFEGIKRGVHSYLPDFKVTTTAGEIEYHEVKGWMDAKSKTKLRRMAKYHPNIKIVVIDAPRYKAIAQTVRGVIPGWITASR